MRHWCAVARLIKTKIETDNFDCYPVENWLGHERMATTEGHIKHAGQNITANFRWIGLLVLWNYRVK